jgi:hypothetical protein
MSLVLKVPAVILNAVKDPEETTRPQPIGSFSPCPYSPLAGCPILGSFIAKGGYSQPANRFSPLQLNPEPLFIAIPNARHSERSEDPPHLLLHLHFALTVAFEFAFAVKFLPSS